MDMNVRCLQQASTIGLSKIHDTESQCISVSEFTSNELTADWNSEVKTANIHSVRFSKVEQDQTKLYKRFIEDSTTINFGEDVVKQTFNKISSETATDVLQSDGECIDDLTKTRKNKAKNHAMGTFSEYTLNEIFNSCKINSFVTNANLNDNFKNGNFGKQLFSCIAPDIADFCKNLIQNAGYSSKSTRGKLKLEHDFNFFIGYILQEIKKRLNKVEENSPKLLKEIYTEITALHLQMLNKLNSTNEHYFESNAFRNAAPKEEMLSFNHYNRYTMRDYMNNANNTTLSLNTRGNIFGNNPGLKICNYDKKLDTTHGVEITNSNLYETFKFCEYSKSSAKLEVSNCCKIYDASWQNDNFKMDLNSVISKEMPNKKSNLSTETELLDKIQTVATITLTPEQFKRDLIDKSTCANVEILSDFCRKFGHSDICLYASLCKFKNKDKCEICEFYCIPKNDFIGKMKHVADCRNKVKRKFDTSENANVPFRAQSCELCKKTVSISGSVSSRYYGILRNCEHVFCLNCADKCRTNLRARDEHNIIICRVCGTYSPFYAASNRWIDKKDRREFFRSYEKSLESVKCSFCNVNSNSEIRKGICYHRREIPTGNNVQSMIAQYLLKSKIKCSPK